MDGQCGGRDDCSLDAVPKASYNSQRESRATVGTGLVGFRAYDAFIADAFACESSTDDDEMLRWLHYPAEADLVDKGYCSDMFGALPVSLVVPEMTVRRSGELEGELLSVAHTPSEMAMELGYGRAAGLVRQPGLEAFAKVRTTFMPQISVGGELAGSKQQNWNCNQHINSQKEDIPACFDLSSSHISSLRSDHVNWPLITSSLPKSQMNLRILTQYTDPIKTPECYCSSVDHVHRPSNVSTVDGIDVTDGYTSDSATCLGDASRSASAHIPISEVGFNSPSQVPLKQLPAEAKKGGAVCQPQLDSCQHSTTSGSTSSKETNFPRLGDSADLTEATVTTTSSGVSENLCTKMSPPAVTKSSREIEDLAGLQNEGAGESKGLKKPATARSSSKRNRAAEVHNLSERRRRDRINEKMRALRELIPDSDKCDKASILDDAIEYVKLLQLQIQMMFLRSGVSVPAKLLPTETLHMPLEMGLSLEMGIGLGISLPNFATTGHPAYALQSLAGSPHFPAASMHAVGSQNHMQSSSIINTHRAYNDQPLNMELWSPYVMHQFHRQQFHQGNEHEQN